MKALVIAITAVAVSVQPVMASGDGSPAKSKAPLYGTLIGLAAGVTAGGLFFGLSNCHYGSDSGAAMAACAGVTGGLIVGGTFAGRAIGRKIAKRPTPQPESAGMTLDEQRAEAARVARTMRVGTASRRLGAPPTFWTATPCGSGGNVLLVTLATTTTIAQASKTTQFRVWCVRGPGLELR